MKKITLLLIILLITIISGCATTENSTKNKEVVDENQETLEETQPSIEKQEEVIEISKGETNEEINPILENTTEMTIPENTTEMTIPEKLNKELAGGYKITSEQLTKIQEKVKVGSDSALLTTSYPSGLSYGETHVFAFGLSNKNPKEKIYKIGIDFIQAKNNKNNAIENLNTDDVLDWFKHNKFNEISLDGNEVGYMPIGVAITKELPPGLYDFKVIIMNKDLDDDDWEKLNANIKFTITLK